MRIVHQTMADAVAHVKKRLGEASEAGKWMVAIWSKRGDKITLDRTSHHFSAADFDRAVRDLVKDLGAEKAETMLPDDPLPTAPGFGFSAMTEQERQMQQFRAMGIPKKLFTGDMVDEAIKVDLPEDQGGDGEVELEENPDADHEGV